MEKSTIPIIVFFTSVVSMSGVSTISLYETAASASNISDPGEACPSCKWALIGAGRGCPSPKGGEVYVAKLLERYSTISLPSYRMTPPTTTPPYKVTSPSPEQKFSVLSALLTAPLKVEYPGGLLVTLNALLAPSQLTSPPRVSWDAVGNNQLYTMAMVDPDARSGKIATEWLHWLVVNIPGAAVTEGKVYAEYIGPAPSPGTGPHRYVLLVYKQPNGDIEDTDFSRKSRAGWSAEDFAKKHGFGAPIAGIFYRAENSGRA